MNIPTTLQAGDTISWTESSADYPPSGGWTLAFSLQMPDRTPITITGTASGTSYAISVSPSTSKGWLPGTYSWQAYVYKGTPPAFTDRITLATGEIEIIADISQATSQNDFRSTARKNYEMITAALSGDGSPYVQSYSIGGRSLSKYSRAELIKERSFWKTEWDKERQEQALAQGLDFNPRRVGIRFVDV
jgi:hypothetical protein